jgi:hypothetical protein
MKNKQLLLIAGAAAVAAGAYYAFFKKPAPTNTDLTLPPAALPPAALPVTLPPAALPPAALPAALVIGDTVKAAKKFRMYTEDLGIYSAGGSNGNGEQEAGVYAGKIIGFYTGASSGTNYAKLQTFTNRPKDSAGNLVSVYLTPTTNLTK